MVFQRVHEWMLVLLPALIFALPAYSISRVGNCVIGDAADGFTAQVPITFADITTAVPDTVTMLQVPISMGPIEFSPARIASLNADSLRDDFSFPDGVSQVTFIATIEALGGTWTTESVSNPCIVALTSTDYQSGNRMTLASWGDNKGIVIHNQSSADADSAVQAIVLAIQLQAGACSW